MFTGTQPTLRVIAVRPEPQQRRSRETRGKLLVAAEALFARDGFERTTTNAIARRAGVSIGTFYLHFPDKRAVFLAVFDRLRRKGLHTLGLVLDPLPATPDEFRARLLQIVDGVFARQARHAGFRRTLLDLLSRDAHVAARYRDAQATLREFLVQMIEAGQRRGLIRSIDAEAAALVLQTVAEQVAAQAVVYKRLPMADDRLRAMLAEMFSRLLLNTGVESRPPPSKGRTRKEGRGA